MNARVYQDIISGKVEAEVTAAKAAKVEHDRTANDLAFANSEWNNHFYTIHFRQQLTNRINLIYEQIRKEGLNPMLDDTALRARIAEIAAINNVFQLMETGEYPI